MISKETLDKLEFYKVVNYITRYCVTENGKNDVLNLSPLGSAADSSLECNKVNEAKEILIRNDNPPLEFIPDLHETLSRCKIEGTILQAKQILDVLKLIECSRKMLQFLKSKKVESNYLTVFHESLLVDKVLEHQITKIFTESGEIRDDASPKLKEIRNDIKEKELQLRKLVNKLLKQLSESYLVQEEYITLRDGRIVLPIKSEHKRHIKGFIHSESSTGQTVYIEPEETLELNNDILSLNFAEKREIEKILKNITQRIGNSADLLKLSLNTIAILDSIFARAKYSLEILGTFPSFDCSKAFHFINAKHPLLIKKIGLDKTVPLNLKVDGLNVILITGPNAGGKTVALKTTGLLVLLAQSAIPIPASPDSNITFFENVLVDIGDAQSIEDDLSTFSSHLTNIKNIIEQADKNSLVIIDEIGTGTDPEEGAAIASGFLVTLRDRKSTVLATTHHGALKIIANQLSGFQNASMEFDSDELKPTYIFNQGMPGSSYAFEVAGRIGFDDKFLSLAKEFLDKDKTKIEDFLVNLEKKSKKLREQLHRIEIENTRLKGLANLYQDKIEKLEKQKKEILDDTREKAEIYLSGINKKIELAIKNIRESNADKAVIKKEKEIIKTFKEELTKTKTETKSRKEEEQLKVGSFAKIKGTTSVGKIDEYDIEKNRAVLTIGSLKIKAKYSDLESAQKSEYEDYDYKRYEANYQNISHRLDLRGKRVEEAEFEIIKFLDNSVMNGLDRVEILHGKGTGALKQLVQSILKEYIHVKNYYYSGIESGGDGITIIELK